MDGATYHERLRILLHDKGTAYKIARPFWSPEELTLRSQAAIATLYTTMIERAEMTGELPVTLNRMIALSAATAGSDVPPDYFRVIIGRKSTGQYVNTDPMPVAAASAGFDVVYASAGKWRGTADTAYYWRQPVGPWDPASADVTDLPDAFFDTSITLAAIETIMGEQQDAADRLDVLYELFQSQIETLN